MRKRLPLGPYRRPMPRVLRGSWWVGRFLMGEVPLQTSQGQILALAFRLHILDLFHVFPHPIYRK